MTKTIFCLSAIILGLCPAAARAASNPDFDGRHKNNSMLIGPVEGAESAAGEPSKAARLIGKITRTSDTGAITESVPLSTTKSPIAKIPRSNNNAIQGLIIEHEACTSPHECSPVEPDGALTAAKRFTYTFSPGALLRSAFNCTKGEWKMQLDYAIDARSAGHEHSEIQPPPLPIGISTGAAIQWSYPAVPVNFSGLQKNTTYYFWTILPAFAATIDKTFLATGACAGKRTDYIKGRITGLLELPPSDIWYFPGNHPSPAGYAHWGTHHGTQRLIDAIISIAKEYRETHPAADILTIYDMSLPYGGTIDINQDWKRPFYGHTAGVDADISKQHVHPENRKALLEIMCRHADTYSEQDVPGAPAYFHIRTTEPGQRLLLDNFAEAPRTTVKCCDGNTVIIDPEILNICLSTGTRAY